MQPDFDSQSELARFALNEGSDTALMLIAEDGLIIDAVGAASMIFGGDAREMRGGSITTIFASGGAETRRPKIVEQVLKGRFMRRRCWCVRRDRSRFWAEVTGAPVWTAGGSVAGCTLAVRDLTELKAAESAATLGSQSRAAESQSAIAQAMLDGISNALFAVDESLRFVYLNTRCAQMLRKPREQLVGAALWDELPVSEGSSFRRNLHKASAEHMPVQFEEFYPLLNAWFEVHAYPYSGGLVVYFWDISDRKLEGTRMKQQSLRDPLTGVANSLLLQDRLTTALARTQRSKTSVALVLLDLDGFAAINAEHGHSVGDVLLQSVAARLDSVVRRSDTIARLAGDEFAIVTSDQRHADGPALLAEKLLAAAAQTFELSEASLEMTASVGIALYPQDAADADGMIKAADAALAAAKAEGGNTYRFFSSALTQEMKRRRSVESELRAAVAAKQFEIWYQPERGINTGELTAMEALLRWNRGEGLCERASEFMPNVYSTDLIVKMDEWVLSQACGDRNAWSAAGAPGVPITVNISDATLAYGNLPSLVKRVLETTSLDPKLLELEFQQAPLRQVTPSIIKDFAELRAIGVGLSLDDVGENGWATLSLVEEYSFGKIKIDAQHFIGNDGGKSAEGAIRAASSFAHAMSRRVVAERIESEQQMEFMRMCGCDAAQGEFVGAPLAAHANGLRHIAVGAVGA